MIALLVAALLAPVQAADAPRRQAIGIFDNWGAFRDSAPARCYAISQPVPAQGGAFAAIADWPRAGTRGQLHIRLSRPRDPRARVTLAIGERRFELVAGASDAWAPDARTDRAIVAAIRSSRSMSVESVGTRGGAFADVYTLRGAASAIDAAALACMRR